MMKAAIATAYGSPDVIRIAEVPTPAPKANEILVRIHASAVNAADWRLRSVNPWFVRLVFGPFKPRRPILGVVFAGEVVGTGAAVTKYTKGDKLFGWTSLMKLVGTPSSLRYRSKAPSRECPMASPTPMRLRSLSASAPHGTSCKRRA